MVFQMSLQMAPIVDRNSYSRQKLLQQIGAQPYSAHPAVVHSKSPLQDVHSNDSTEGASLSSAQGLSTGSVSLNHC